MNRSPAVCVLALVFAAGCPDDPADTGDDAGTTAAGTTGMATPPVTTAPGSSSGTTAPASTGDPTDASSSSGSSGEPGTTTGVTTGTGECDPSDPQIAEACEAAYETLLLCPEATQCRCDACGCELDACLTDPGCTALRDCTIETGCTGLDCLEKRNCAAVFEKHGGAAGEPSLLLQALGSCLEAAACPPCDGGTGTTTGTSTTN